MMVSAIHSLHGVFLICWPCHKVGKTCTRALPPQSMHSMRKLKWRSFRSCAGWISRHVATTQRNTPITNNVLPNRLCQSQHAIVLYQVHLSGQTRGWPCERQNRSVLQQSRFWLWGKFPSLTEGEVRNMVKGTAIPLRRMLTKANGVRKVYQRSPNGKTIFPAQKSPSIWQRTQASVMDIWGTSDLPVPFTSDFKMGEKKKPTQTLTTTPLKYFEFLTNSTAATATWKCQGTDMRHWAILFRHGNLLNCWYQTQGARDTPDLPSHTPLNPDFLSIFTMKEEKQCEKHKCQTDKVHKANVASK